VLRVALLRGRGHCARAHPQRPRAPGDTHTSVGAGGNYVSADIAWPPIYNMWTACLPPGAARALWRRPSISIGAKLKCCGAVFGPLSFLPGGATARWPHRPCGPLRSAAAPPRGATHRSHTRVARGGVGGRPARAAGTWTLGRIDPVRHGAPPQENQNPATERGTPGLPQGEPLTPPGGFQWRAEEAGGWRLAKG